MHLVFDAIPAAGRRTNPVDELFRQWKAASAQEREAIENQMRGPLRKYARYSAWRYLPRSNDPHFVIELVDDLLLKMSDFRGDNRSHFSTWAYKVFANRCIDRWRQLRREVSLEEHMLAHPGIEPASPETHPDEHIYCEQVYSRLPRILSSVLRARAEGDTLSEIASQHNVTKMAIHYRIERAKEMLARAA